MELRLEGFTCVSQDHRALFRGEPDRMALQALLSPCVSSFPVLFTYIRLLSRVAKDGGLSPAACAALLAACAGAAATGGRDKPPCANEQTVKLIQVPPAGCWRIV